jgi:hypothetical protein
LSHSPPVYSAINFIVRYGALLAVAVGLLPVFASIAAIALGLHWWVLLAGIATSSLLYMIMKSYVELVCIMSDMLIPK